VCVLIEQKENEIENERKRTPYDLHLMPTERESDTRLNENTLETGCLFSIMCGRQTQSRLYYRWSSIIRIIFGQRLVLPMISFVEPLLR